MLLAVIILTVTCWTRRHPHHYHHRDDCRHSPAHHHSPHDDTPALPSGSFIYAYTLFHFSPYPFDSCVLRYARDEREKELEEGLPFVAISNLWEWDITVWFPVSISRQVAKEGEERRGTSGWKLLFCQSIEGEESEFIFFVFWSKERIDALSLWSGIWWTQGSTHCLLLTVLSLWKRQGNFKFADSFAVALTFPSGKLTSCCDAWAKKGGNNKRIERLRGKEFSLSAVVGMKRDTQAPLFYFNPYSHPLITADTSHTNHIQTRDRSCERRSENASAKLVCDDCPSLNQWVE